MKNLLQTIASVLLAATALNLPQAASGQILRAADQVAIGHAAALALIQQGHLEAAKAHLEAKSLFPHVTIRARRATAYASARQQRYEASKQQLYTAIAEHELARERRALFAAQREDWRADGVYLPVVDLSQPLQWPSSLRAPEFAVLRGHIERTAERWARTTSADAGDDRDLLIDLTARLTDELKGRIHTMRAERYVEGRRFLEELKLAARRPLPVKNGLPSQLAVK